MMRRTRAALRTAVPALLAALALLSLGAAPPETEGPSRDLHTPSDRDITRAIEGRLARSGALSLDRIDVSTSRGLVVLEGSVSSLPAKREARRIALGVRGVRDVVNRLEVRTPGRSDSALTRDIELALASDPGTAGYKILPRVKDGVVTLTGTVDSWPAKTLAAEVAAGVKGVREVRNDIVANFKERRPDADIKAEVEALLRRDATIDAAAVTVAVDRGNVALVGAVASGAEREKAIADAWVPGVQAVDASRLAVDPGWALRKLRRADVYVRDDGRGLVEGVRAAILADPRVRASGLGVEVQDRTITLVGVVDNLRAREAAEQDALGVLGVQRVRNLLRVRPTRVPDDTALTQAVRAALMRDPYVSSAEVAVRARDGMVILSGDVDSAYERDRAAALAGAVAGVSAVRNRLRVATGTPVPAAPRDWALKQDIEEALRWDPLVNAGAIRVKVRDRVASLDGTVDTWRQRERAADLAYKAGALSVQDHLKVRFGPVPPVPPR